MIRPHSTWLRGLTLTLSACAIAALAATPARALELGVRAGAVVDDADPFVGIELLAPLGSQTFFNPNVEFVDRGERDRVSANFDFHYDFYRDQDLTLWGGGGVAAIHTDGGRGRDSQTDAGVNLLAGIGWRVSNLTPYAQVKLVLSDDSAIYAGVGVRF